MQMSLLMMPSLDQLSVIPVLKLLKQLFGQLPQLVQEPRVLKPKVVLKRTRMINVR